MLRACCCLLVAAASLANASSVSFGTADAAAAAALPSEKSQVAMPAARLYEMEGFLVKPFPAYNPSDARILLNGGEHVAIPRASDGRFVFAGVQDGTHLLEVRAIGFVYPQLRVRVSAKQGGRVEAEEMRETANGPRTRYASPLRLQPKGRISYFDKREQFSIMQFIANPMMLMMMMTMGMAYCMPKMMEGIEEDEEMKEEMSKMREGGIGAMLGGGGAEKPKTKKRQ